MRNLKRLKYIICFLGLFCKSWWPRYLKCKTTPRREWIGVINKFNQLGKQNKMWNNKINMLEFLPNFRLKLYFKLEVYLLHWFSINWTLPINHAMNPNSIHASNPQAFTESTTFTRTHGQSLHPERNEGWLMMI